MKRLTILLIAVLSLASIAVADKPTAEALLASAKTRAAQEHKNIFVMFDASW
jgi:hypothetical protein